MSDTPLRASGLSDAPASTPPASGPSETDELREAMRAGGIACAGERDAARAAGRVEDAHNWERFAGLLHAAARVPLPEGAAECWHEDGKCDCGPERSGLTDAQAHLVDGFWRVLAGEPRDGPIHNVLLKALRETRSAHSEGAGEPNYAAALAEYRRVTAYWPPEWINSPDHFEKMLDSVLMAAALHPEQGQADG